MTTAPKYKITIAHSPCSFAGVPGELTYTASQTEAGVEFTSDPFTTRAAAERWLTCLHTAWLMRSLSNINTPKLQ